MGTAALLGLPLWESLACEFALSQDPSASVAAAFLRGKVYKKGKKRRTRYECISIDSGRIYAFNPNAEVELMDA